MWFLASIALVSSSLHCSWKLILHCSCKLILHCSCKLIISLLLLQAQPSVWTQNLAPNARILFAQPISGSGSEQVLASMPPKVVMERSLKMSFGDGKLCAIPQGLVGNHCGREWLKLQWTSQALLTLLCSSCTSSIPKNASLASSLKVQELKLKRSLKRRRTSQRDRRGPVHRWWQWVSMEHKWTSTALWRGWHRQTWLWPWILLSWRLSLSSCKKIAVC